VKALTGSTPIPLGVEPFRREHLTGEEFKMRRFFSFILAASLLLAPSAALAQNNSALASTDKVMIDRVNANGEGTPGAISVLNLFNGTGVGYGVGGGGAVTQITSRATAVTLNSFSGQITMFSAAGSATAASFTVNDSLVKTTDVIEVMPSSGTNVYLVQVTGVTNGTFTVTFFTTGGTATDAPVINFAVVHASAS
jgi:hypothetical protein